MAMMMVFWGVIIILAALGIVARGGKTAEAKFEIRLEDVVRDAPYVAVHEMTASTVAQIEFFPKDGPQPQIAISESFYDFGGIGATEVARHDFAIANQGDAPLTIHRAYTTCGCTTAEFSALVIPPGKMAIMTLVLDAGFHDARGQTVRRGVIIESNDPNNPQIEIWSQAKVRNE
jgi:hypothetical protein